MRMVIEQDLTLGKCKENTAVDMAQTWFQRCAGKSTLKEGHEKPRFLPSGKRLHNYGTWSIEIDNTHITMEHGAF